MKIPKTPPPPKKSTTREILDSTLNILSFSAAVALGVLMGITMFFYFVGLTVTVEGPIKHKPVHHARVL